MTPTTAQSRTKDRHEEARATVLLTEDELDCAARDIVHQVLSRFIGLKRSVRARGRDLETVLNGKSI